MKNMKKWILGVGGTTLVALFIGLLVIVFTLARGQQAIFQKEPVYSAPELFEKGQEQLEKQDYKQAEEYLEKAVSKESNPEYYNQLAIVKYRLEKYEESISQYRKLISANKDVAFAWNGIGNSYRDWAAGKTGTEQEKLNNESESAYRNALKENPQYVAAYANLAILQIRMNKPEEARTTLDAGILKTGRDELKTTKGNLGL